jgi:hypothetical protein
MRNKKNARILLVTSRYLRDSVFEKTMFLRNCAKILNSRVKYHEYCMKNYIVRYQKKKKKVTTDIIESDSVREYLSTIDFKEEAHSLTELSSLVHQKFPEKGKLTNAQIKKSLQKIHDEKINFIRSNRKNEPQIATSIPEMLASSDYLGKTADLLKNECQNHDFGLDGKLCDESDLYNAEKQYSESRPPNWVKFFEKLVPNYRESEQVQKKCDMVYEIIYNIIHGRKKSPLMVANSQLLHEKSRSKTLIR